MSIDTPPHLRCMIALEDFDVEFVFRGSSSIFQASDARALRVKFDVLSRTLRLSDGMGVAAADQYCEQLA